MLTPGALGRNYNKSTVMDEQPDRGPPPPMSPPAMKKSESTYWQEQSHSAIDTMYLEAETKQQIEQLYQLLDANQDGQVSIEDFALPSGEIPRERQAQWEMLRDEFDFDRNGVVDADEFVNGVKRQALKSPLDPGCFPSIPTSHKDCLLWLNASVNNTIQQLCKALYETMRPAGLNSMGLAGLS